MHTLPLGDARDFCPRHRPKVYTPRHPRVGCGPSGVSGGRRVSREPIRADLEFHGDGYSG